MSFHELFSSVDDRAPSRDGQGGFTLIEVIVVIGVLSIIATTIGPLVVRQLQRQRVSTTEANLTTIAQALAEYYYDNEIFPATISDSVLVAEYLPGVVGGELHKDPMVRYQADLGYILTASNGQATVYSRGEDGVDNSAGGDDILVVVSSSPSGKKRTRNRLALIGVALERYLGADPSNQLVGDWLGVDRVALGLSTEFDRDSWAIAFQTSAGEIMVRSSGPDLMFGTSDDLTL